MSIVKPYKSAILGKDFKQDFPNISLFDL